MIDETAGMWGLAGERMGSAEARIRVEMKALEAALETLRRSTLLHLPELLGAEEGHLKA